VTPVARTIYTVGHSNRRIEALIEILRAAGVGALADIRRVPQSRFNPQFRKQALAAALASHGLAYEWIEELGGHREPSATTPHVMLDAPFAGYAEHLRSAEFARGIERLTDRHETADTAVMCAEAAYLRCHRRILADWLTVRGWTVVHLVDAARREPHVLSAEARVVDGELVYDRGTQPSLM
jgi:uncharacterized protein (DUF488 family)